MSEKPMLALDIGSAKAVAVVAQRRRDGGLETLALAEQPTCGAIRQGVVINIEGLIGVLTRLIGELHRGRDLTWQEVCATIAGAHVQSLENVGTVSVRSGEVSGQDVARVLAAAQQLPLAEERQLLHALVQEFLLDDWVAVADPIGLSARQLGVRLHIVSGLKSATNNLVKSIRRAGLDLTTLMVQGLAAAQAVLTEDEKRLGALLLDIGAGTTDVVVYGQEAVRLTASLPVGGNRLTHAVAMAFRTPLAEAERLKCLYGAADYHWCKSDEVIEVAALGDRPMRRIARQRLVDVLHPQVAELFAQVWEMVVEQGLDEQIGAGVVLTGGTAKLNGIADLAESVFGLPARVGVPYLGNDARSWEDPAYAAVSGLLQTEWNDVTARPRRASERWWRRWRAWLGIGAT